MMMEIEGVMMMVMTMMATTATTRMMHVGGSINFGES